MKQTGRQNGWTQKSQKYGATDQVVTQISLADLFTARTKTGEDISELTEKEGSIFTLSQPSFLNCF